MTNVAALNNLQNSRPKVSVCMAAHNGARFILMQILSILLQLDASDELIIVDDCSIDGTCEVIERCHDARIEVKRNESNQGILRSFESAISKASGDIIFLADQDDIWAASKVSIILQAFRTYPTANIVVSDAELIDENGSPLGTSYYSLRGKFRPGVLTNVIRCKYLGCTMAFRSRIRARILPFPVGADVFHDLWIGTSNSLAGGKTLYIDRPLVQYRRHAANVTGHKRLSTARQIRTRLDLCLSLAKSWLRLHCVSNG